MPAKTTQAGLQNSFVVGIALTVSQLLSSRNILPEIIGPVEDLRPRGVGNTVRFLRAPKGTLRDATDLSGKTYDTPTQLFDELSLNYFREVNFQYGSLDETIGQNEITIDQYAVSGAAQMGNDIEKNTMLEVLDDPTIPAGNILGSLTTQVNEALFATLAQKFEEQNIPEGERIVVLSPKHYYEAVRNVEAFKSQDFVERGTVSTGKLPVMLYGMKVYLSNQLPAYDDLTSVGGTDTNEASVAFWSQAVKFSMAGLPAPLVSGATLYALENIDGYVVRSRAWDDNNLNAKRLVMDCIYGVKVVENPTTKGSTNVKAIYPIEGGI
jgi:hypothetical protein